MKQIKRSVLMVGGQAQRGTVPNTEFDCIYTERYNLRRKKEP